MSHPPQRRRAVSVPVRRPPVELKSVRVFFDEDPDADVSYLEQDDFEDRLASYRRGGFHFVGVRIEAEVSVAETVQRLVSPGLAGIESDTDETELDRIIDEEWVSLRTVLKTIGVSTEQLPLAVDRAWVEWRT